VKKETAARIFLAILVVVGFFLFMGMCVKIYNEQDQRVRIEVANEEKENEELSKTGHIRIGMTAKQCRAAWGEPEKVNRTRRAEGVHDQWVYDEDHYLYLDNGVLRSIQGIGRPESAPAEATPSAPAVEHFAVQTATPAPTMATAPPPPDFTTLTQDVSISVPYGVIGLQRGTKLKLIGRDDARARVRYDNADYWIPIGSTDLR